MHRRVNRYNNSGYRDEKEAAENGRAHYELAVKHTGDQVFVDTVLDLTKKVRGFVFRPPSYDDEASRAFKKWHDAKIADGGNYEGKTDYIKPRPLTQEERENPIKPRPLSEKQKADFVSIITQFCQQEDFALTYILELVMLDWMKAELKRQCGEDYDEMSEKILFYKTSLYDDVKYKTDWIVSLLVSSLQEKHFALDLKVSENEKYIKTAKACDFAHQSEKPKIGATAVCSEFKYFKGIPDTSDTHFPRFVFGISPTFAFAFLYEYLEQVMSEFGAMDVEDFAWYTMRISERSVEKIETEHSPAVRNAMEKTRKDFERLLQKDVTIESTNSPATSEKQIEVV